MSSKGCVVAFDARDQFRIARLIGQCVVVAATANKAWARASPALGELLRSAGYFKLPEGTEEPARKGAHTGYKRKGVKERQEALFPQLLKEIEEKRAARSVGNEWGGEARYGAALRHELAKQAYPLIGGTEEEKKVFFDRVIGAHPECFYTGVVTPDYSRQADSFSAEAGREAHGATTDLAVAIRSVAG